MNHKNNQLQEWTELDCDSMNFDELEKKLNSELKEQMADLKGLELDREKIGNPDTIGHTVMNVVWEQFINQVGVIAGEDFIKENRGLTLDLRDSAHIQTTKNFAAGEIATHNNEIDYQERYDDWQNNFAKDDQGKIIMVPKRFSNEMVEKIKPGARNYLDGESGSVSMPNDHTVSAVEIIRDPEANAHLSRPEQHTFATGDKNFLPLDGHFNASKRDATMTDALNHKHDGKRAAERFNIDEKELQERDKIARAEFERQKKEGELRSIETGKKSQKKEALRISGKALRAVVMGLLASLIKDIIRKLISWFRSGNRKLNTFIESVKAAIKSFLSNLKEHLLNAANTFVTTIATAIFGPVIGMIKKAWIFLKQGYKSVKEAITFLKNPENKNMPLSLKMMEVGKIVIVGLTAGGAIVLSEVIEKGLMTFPVFAFNIPIIGSLASLMGMFLGSLVSGIIGALALNQIDRLIAKKLKTINTQQQFHKKNDILVTQEQLIKVNESKVENTRNKTIESIKKRHTECADLMKESIEKIKSNSEDIYENSIEEAEIIEDEEKNQSENRETLDSITNILKQIN
nr:cation diffusion facilitator family transporter [uncultured Prevotella sp.]